MKYIVLEVTDWTGTGRNKQARELPVIFPEAMIHSEVAHALALMLNAERPGKRTVKAVSAGNINSMDLMQIECCGKSETLGLQSRGIVDDQLMRMLDYSHGIT
jgi:hypothetical protein